MEGAARPLLEEDEEEDILPDVPGVQPLPPEVAGSCEKNAVAAAEGGVEVVVVPLDNWEVAAANAEPILLLMDSCTRGIHSG